MIHQALSGDQHDQCLLLLASLFICAGVGNLCVCSTFLDEFCVAFDSCVACKVNATQTLSRGPGGQGVGLGREWGDGGGAGAEAIKGRRRVAGRIGGPQTGRQGGRKCVHLCASRVAMKSLKCCFNACTLHSA